MAHNPNIQNLLREVTAPIGEKVDTLLRDLTPHLLTLRYPRAEDDLKATRDTVRNALTIAILELDRLNVIYDHAEELAALVPAFVAQGEATTTEKEA